MSIPVWITVKSTQYYEGEEPTVITLDTEGQLAQPKPGFWELSYEETELTGLAGVTTAFRVSPRGVILRRTGKLQSQMIFIEGQRHESLYQMDFGALMLTVVTTKIENHLTGAGGTLEVAYTLEIEGTVAGRVEYRLDIRPSTE